MLTLYSYYRSSAAYRVRIALNIKQIEHRIVPIDLLKAQHKESDYLRKQPQGLLPCIETQDGQLLGQSGAILDYLEARFPTPSLLLNKPFGANKVRSFSDIIACDIHPICNLRVLNYLRDELSLDAQQKMAWYHHWLKQGFNALENMLGDSTYCFAEQVTLADIYLVPQIYNALRFEYDMAVHPKLMAVYTACNRLDSFIQAQPEHQIDAPNNQS